MSFYKYNNPLLSLDKILEKSRQTHGDRYDYSLVKESFGSKTNMKIICKVHGMFEQKASNHYGRAAGCQQCAKEYNYVKTSQSYQRAAKAKHGERYDYSKSLLEGNSKGKITITCNQCGKDFEEYAINHLHGYGCSCS